MDLEDVAKHLLEKKNYLGSDDPDVREQLVADLVDRMENLANRAILDAMSPAEATAFGKILDEGDDSKIAAATQKPHIQAAVLKALQDFKERY